MAGCEDATCVNLAGMKPPIFTELTVCGLDELAGHSDRGVTHVLSILDPGWPDPGAFEHFDPHFRATVHFHDAIEPDPSVVMPEQSDVERILAFGREAGDERHLLIHCHAGISRSTAAMLMVLAQAHPTETEEAIVDRLLKIRPQAWPNSRMVAFADEVSAATAASSPPSAASTPAASKPNRNSRTSCAGSTGRGRWSWGWLERIA